MKHLVSIVLTIFLFGCNNKPNNPAMILSFDPAAGKTYFLELKTISTRQDSYGISGDTLFFNFELVTKLKDTMGDRMAFIIQKLSLRKSPNKIFGHLSAGGVKQKNYRAANVMMEQYLLQREQIMSKLAGDTIQLIINKSGQLIMEDGLDVLVQNTSEELGFEPTEVKRVVKNFLSASVMKDFLNGIFFYLPARQIKEKDNWVNNTIFNAMAPVKHSNLVSVDTITDRDVVLKINAQISVGGEGEQYLKGTKAGFVKADLISGFPIQMQLKEESITSTTGGDVLQTKNTRISCQIK